MTSVTIIALIIFSITYLLISVRRLPFASIGRPAAAVLGATLMVLFQVMTPEEAYRAVNGDTIVLLLGMMILTEHLREAGFFQLAAAWTFRVARSPRSLLCWIALTSGVLSALFVNDTVCLLMTPLIVQVLAQTKLPRFPFLMALATASNIGSVMTLVGNPQNMIIGSLAAPHLDYPTFALYMIPVGLACLLLHIVFLLWLFRTELNVAWEPQPIPAVKLDVPLMRRSLLVALGVSVAFCCRVNPAWAALAGASALFLWNRKHPSPTEVLVQVNWSLLLFFAGLFITVHGLQSSGFTRWVWEQAAPLWDTSATGQQLNLVWLSVVGSNIVSNVPFIELMRDQMTRFVDPKTMWLLLALSTTFAGNLTLLGSVANIIVMEVSGEPVSFWQYCKIGVPVTLLSCVVGTGLLLLLT